MCVKIEKSIEITDVMLTKAQGKKNKEEKREDDVELPWRGSLVYSGVVTVRQHRWLHLSPLYRHRLSAPSPDRDS